MEAIEYFIYTLLFLVLIAFIGVIGYIIYDNYTYKNNLTSDLNTNFLDINQNFNSTSNIIRRLHIKHTSNYNVLDERIASTNADLTQKIGTVNSAYMTSSNVFDNNISDIYSKNIINSNLLTNKIDTFGYNMNKYFSFNNTANKPYNDTNNKIFEYRTLSSDTASRLDLITKTTASAGIKVNSDSNNGLEICNKTGTNCFNMYGDDDNLYIYGKNATTNNIYIGSTNKNTAPIRIENGVVKLDDVYGSNYTRNSSNYLIDYIASTSNQIMKDVNALRVSQYLLQQQQQAQATAQAQAAAAAAAAAGVGTGNVGTGAGNVGTGTDTGAGAGAAGNVGAGAAGAAGNVGAGTGAAGNVGAGAAGAVGT
jgi:hypothetical protein